MKMNAVKIARESFGYTQIELAEKSGLSLRTIQRVETNNTPPKGHTLKSLALALGVNPSELQDQFLSAELDQDDDILAIQWMNVATLGFFILPLGNIFLPYFLWRTKRSQALINESGRRIINFQILWTIGLYIALCISPFINAKFLGQINLILLVLLFGVLINLSVFLSVASKIRNRTFNFLDLDLRVF